MTKRAPYVNILCLSIINWLIELQWTKECICNSGKTSFDAIEFSTNNSRIALICGKCHGVVCWWPISTEQAAQSEERASPKISVNSEDFWKTFGPLLKQSINGSWVHLNKVHRSTLNGCKASSKYQLTEANDNFPQGKRLRKKPVMNQDGNLSKLNE